MKNLLGKIHNIARLRWALLGFLLALGMPTAVLVYYSLSELRWESFHQQRTLAIELSDRLNEQINRWVFIEEQRAYADYQFLVVSGDPAANYVQKSSLSALTVPDSIPGAVGYFQVDADGQFSSPILPSTYLDATRYGISADEYRQREQQREELLQVLLDNQILQTQAPRVIDSASQFVSGLQNIETQIQSVEARDDSQRYSMSRNLEEPDADLIVENAAPPVEQKYELQEEQFQSSSPSKSKSSAQVDATRKQPKNAEKDSLLSELNIDNKLLDTAERRRTPRMAADLDRLSRSARTEQTLLPQLSVPSSQSEDVEVASVGISAMSPAITMFESEIDPFEVGMLDSGHWVFYRKVWNSGQRAIQGLIIDQATFLDQIIGHEYRDTVLSSTTDLFVAYAGSPMAVYRGEESYPRSLWQERSASSLLFQNRLSSPFNQIELLFTVNQLPQGPGAMVVKWSALTMSLVLGIGTWLLYRLGLRQMRLVQQQQDFVSAVSHELKTPLTSIRMYGEMLKEGWADDNKKRQYYDFIFDESERLSRLITNVLQLAKMNRKELPLVIKKVSIGEVVDLLKSKLMNQVESAGFSFVIKCESSLLADDINIDLDAFTQVMINLVDNALKFSAKSENKVIQLTISPQENRYRFSLRDHGPGVDQQHLKKIFELFYRAENELTRETVGTGIGLALVKQLLDSMGGTIEVRNCQPGAEFTVVVQAEKS